MQLMSHVYQYVSSALQRQHRYVLYSAEICPKPEASPDEVLMNLDVRVDITLG